MDGFRSQAGKNPAHHTRHGLILSHPRTFKYPEDETHAADSCGFIAVRLRRFEFEDFFSSSLGYDTFLDPVKEFPNVRRAAQPAEGLGNLWCVLQPGRIGAATGRARGRAGESV